MSTVDVIIPTYHIPAGFDKLLKALETQTIPVHRVIIMHTMDPEGEIPVLGNYPFIEVHPVKKEDFDHGGTRHEGMCLSDADYVLMLTQDVEVRQDTLVEKMLAYFGDPSVAVCCGRQLARDDAKETERFTRVFNYPETSRVKTKEDIETLGIKAFFCSDVCAMYDRVRYFELGGFIRHTIFNEDMIFAHGVLMASLKVAYAADAAVVHSHNYTGMQQLRRNFDLGVSQKDHPEVFGGVSSSEEGKKLVLETALHLLKKGKLPEVVQLVYMSGMKFIGYKLGTNYERLSAKTVRRLSMNDNYWR